MLSKLHRMQSPVKQHKLEQKQEESPESSDSFVLFVLLSFIKPLTMLLADNRGCFKNSMTTKRNLSLLSKNSSNNYSPQMLKSNYNFNLKMIRRAKLETM